jgi:hypothetical protein
MNSGRWIVVGLALAGFSAGLQAQEAGGTDVGRSGSLEDDLLIDRPGMEEFNEDLFEEREELMRRPADLNTASRDELLRIPGIPLELVDRLLAWRSAGRIRSYGELRAIPGMAHPVLQILRCHTTIGGPLPPSVVLDVRSRSTIAAEALDDWHRDLPKAQRADNRIGVRVNDLAASGLQCVGGLRLRKDPGSLQYGELRSGFVQVRLKDEASAVIAGTYRIDHAEGLILESGQSRYERTIRNVQRSAGWTRLSPYGGSTENLSLRGVAAEKRWTRWHVVTFYSDRIAHVYLSSPDQLSVVEGREKSIGASAAWMTSGNLSLMSAVVFAGVDRGDVAGRAVTASVGGSFELADASVCGEWAIDRSGRHAWSGQVIVKPTADLSVGSSLRYRAAGFFAPLAGASSPWNGLAPEENVADAAVRFTPGRRLSVQVLLRRERNGNRGWEWTMPLTRWKWEGQLMVRPSEDTEASIQYGAVTTELAHASDDPALAAAARPIAVKRQHVVRFSLAAWGTRTVRIRTRIERSFAALGSAGGHGILLAQEIQLAATPLASVVGRATLFDVDAYDARIFGVEPDLPGAAAISAFDGRGFRWSVAGRLRICAGLELSLKYMHTVVAARRSDSSGGRREEQEARSGGVQLDGRVEIP